MKSTTKTTKSNSPEIFTVTDGVRAVMWRGQRWFRQYDLFTSNNYGNCACKIPIIKGNRGEAVEFFKFMKSSWQQRWAKCIFISEKALMSYVTFKLTSPKARWSTEAVKWAKAELNVDLPEESDNYRRQRSPREDPVIIMKRKVTYLLHSIADQAEEIERLNALIKQQEASGK